MTAGLADAPGCEVADYGGHRTLTRVMSRTESSKPWDLVRSRFFKRDPAETPTTIEKIREEVREAPRRDDTRHWELDVAQILVV